MQCPRCQHVNPAGVKFCGQCGARIELQCPACRAPNPPGNKFCNECGGPLAAAPPAPKFASPQAYTPRHLADKILTSRSALEGERKQVTVLFCDLANSVVLAEHLGPEAMHSLLSRFFELALVEVHRYEGTINQFLGDGFMALFGAPIALEDHAWAAVLAAVAIRRSLGEHRTAFGLPAGAELQVRMGLNTGLVVVGRIGDNLRMDYTAVGDTTNLAARLQEVAEPGAILLSEAARRLVQGYVRVEAFGPVPVKGKPGPVAAYRVVGLGPRRSPLEGLGERALSRFVGRHGELAALHELLAQAEAGRGQVVGLVGEPGVGKSRLLLEFRQALGAKRVTYLQGRCVSYGSAIPYLPLLDILRQNCGIGETDPPDTIVERVRFGLQEVGMGPDEWGPYLLRLLGVKDGSDRLDALSPEAIKARTFETFRQLSLRGSRQRPIIFELEDLHWIDTTSEEFFVSLAESLGGARVLLLVTYRPGYPPPWIEKSYATQIALQPLQPEESVSVLHSVLQASPLPDPLAQVILAKAEGNPFFIEELARAVAEEGDRAAALEVPDTIEEVLLARIDRLRDEPKRLLQTASILGREVSLRLLRAIWDGPGPLDAHLRELTRLEFLYEHDGSDEPVYVFKHALTREVARDTLLTARRRALHAAAGRALETFYADRLEEAYARLAYHYSKSDEHGKAVEYLSRFAESAARTYAHVEAVRALEEALAHVERLPGRDRDRRELDLVLRQAHSLSFLGRFEDTLTLLGHEAERVERLQAPALTAAYHFWLSHTHSHLGDHGRAARGAERAFEDASRVGDEATMGKAYVVLAQEGYWAGQPLHGIARGRRAVELLERAGERWWLGLAHWIVGINYIIIGGFDLALEAETRAFVIGEALGDPRIQSYATWTTGWIHALTGEWEAGIEACKRGLGRSPDPVNTAVAEGHLGYVYLEKGDPAEAIPLLERAVARMGQFQFRRLLGRFTTFLGEAYLLNGQIEKARELVTRGLAITREAEYRYAVGWAQHALGRIARAEGRLAEAESQLADALETFTAVHARFMAGRTHLGLAELAHARGDREAAARRLHEAYSLFRIMRVSRYVERTEALARELGVALSEEMTSPNLAVVRRGEGDLFRTLEEHLAALNVGQVIWDRRAGERRRSRQAAAPDRRREERRRALPVTWDTLGFLLTP